MQFGLVIGQGLDFEAENLLKNQFEVASALDLLRIIHIRMIQSVTKKAADLQSAELTSEGPA